MTETQAHPPVPGAFACSIPASRPLSVLEHDKAYISSDACTVHRAPVDGYDIRTSFHWLNLLRRAFILSQKVNFARPASGGRQGGRAGCGHKSVFLPSGQTDHYRY
jgi:hypothetical protein